MEIGYFSKDYSKKKARDNRHGVEITRNKLEILESIALERINPEIKQEIDRLKKAEWEYNKTKIMGFHLRSKVPHIEEGEADISYYTKLEKRKGEENSIFSLETEDGVTWEGSENVKKVIFDFYSKLYEKEPESEIYQDELLSGIDKFLTREERDMLDQPITKEEIKKIFGCSAKGQDSWFIWTHKRILFLFLE